LIVKVKFRKNPNIKLKTGKGKKYWAKLMAWQIYGPCGCARGVGKRVAKIYLGVGI